MTSLCKKPKLISSLQAILHAVHITSRTWKHETVLEKERISKYNSLTKLIKGPNI